MTSCFEASEDWLALSATVVGGVELDDATLDDVSVAVAEAVLLSRKSDMKEEDNIQALDVCSEAHVYRHRRKRENEWRKGKERRSVLDGGEGWGRERD